MSTAVRTMPLLSCLIEYTRKKLFTSSKYSYSRSHVDEAFSLSVETMTSRIIQGILRNPS